MPYPRVCNDHGIEYCLLAPLEPGQARFSFTGRLQGQTVTWDCCLQTQVYYRSTQPQPALPDPSRNFIDIDGMSATGHCIHIVLNIPHLDTAAILRSIIMVRNYKRLRPGRHVFGEPDSVQF